MNGRLVVFEGLDGVGKTTQIDLLARYLGNQGYDYSTYVEPGSTFLGQRVRAIVKDGYLSDFERLCLFTAARSYLVPYIKSDLEAGRIVVLDRFWPSTYAYQGALDWHMIRAFTEPTGAFDLPVSVVFHLEKSIDAAYENQKDEIEKNANWRAVVNRYAEVYALYRFELPRVIRIDADRTREEIHADIAAVINGL